MTATAKAATAKVATRAKAWRKAHPMAYAVATVAIGSVYAVAVLYAVGVAGLWTVVVPASACRTGS